MRLVHPNGHTSVEVLEHDHGLLRYYRREGWRPVDEAAPAEQEPPVFDAPTVDAEVPPDEVAEISNYPIDSSELPPAGDPLDQEGDQS